MPLFSGFMYAAAVSDYIRASGGSSVSATRVTRRYGPVTLLLAAICVNFFAHHWLLRHPRWLLFAVTALLF
nr:DUF817 family protein [Sphingopyxis sp.]